MNDTEKTQCEQLRAIIDWLYMQSADLFLCGEIIEIHEAREFLRAIKNDPQHGYGNDTLAQHFSMICLNIKPAIEIRIDRMNNALEKIEEAQKKPGT
jgi:hypothetical protein